MKKLGMAIQTHFSSKAAMAGCWLTPITPEHCLPSSDPSRRLGLQSGIFRMSLHGSEKAFAAIAYFVPAFVIMIGVCSQETLTAVSDLMAVLVVMIHPIRQQALAAENFFMASSSS